MSLYVLVHLNKDILIGALVRIVSVWHSDGFMRERGVGETGCVSLYLSIENSQLLYIRIGNMDIWVN